MSDLVEKILQDVKGSSKYKSIDEAFIRSVGEEQLKRRKNVKEAIKFTRAKLHQVGAVYFDGKIDYARWSNILSLSETQDIRDICKMMMLTHASTRERLPILENFYETIFSHLPEIHSVLDVACGLNPLAIPWMNLNESVSYYAYDIFEDLTLFLNKVFEVFKVNGEAFSLDVLKGPFEHKADLAFVLKAIPCLEQVNTNAGTLLLEKIPASHLVISYPIKSLTGKSKGMVINYDERFQAIVEGKNWGIQKIEFSQELVYIVKK